MRTKVLVVAALVFRAIVAHGQVVYVPGRDGVSPPVNVKQIQATYTPEAKAAGVVGDISFAVIVLSDGSVGDVKVIRSCLGTPPIPANREPNGGSFPCRRADEYERIDGFDVVKGSDHALGMDQQAQGAMRQWVFQPAMKDGNPVAVRLVIVVGIHP